MGPGLAGPPLWHTIVTGRCCESSTESCNVYGNMILLLVGAYIEVRCGHLASVPPRHQMFAFYNLFVCIYIYEQFSERICSQQTFQKIKILLRRTAEVQKDRGAEILVKKSKSRSHQSLSKHHSEKFNECYTSSSKRNLIDDSPPAVSQNAPNHT